jgi:hypothetical protein
VTSLLLKRTSVSRPSGEWNDDDYDVLEVPQARQATQTVEFLASRRLMAIATDEKLTKATHAPHLPRIAFKRSAD